LFQIPQKTLAVVHLWYSTDEGKDETEQRFALSSKPSEKLALHTGPQATAVLSKVFSCLVSKSFLF
jgi:hypothetical protein